MSEGLQKAIEFWNGMKLKEHSTGEFVTKDGSVVGYSETVFEKIPPATLTITLQKGFHSYPPEWEEIRDAEFEIIEPKQIENKSVTE